MLDIPDDELRALDALNRKHVEYLLIGGYAMRFYGADRDACDVDLLTSSSRDNAANLYGAVQELIGHPPAFDTKDLEEPRKRIRLWRSGYELEVLTSVEGLDFAIAYRDRTQATERGVTIPVVSRRDLLFIKKAAAQHEKRRAKELRDIAFLESGD